MDYNKVYDNFRKQLTNVHGLTVLMVSVLEIIGYLVLIYSGEEEFSIKSRFLWLSVVCPIVINIATHSFARIVGRRKGVSRKAKNANIISCALVTSFVVAVFHKEYLIASAAFVFPMILSAIFNDKTLLNTTFFSSFFIITCVGALYLFEKAFTSSVMINLIVLLGFSLVSYLCGTISINFSAKSYETIKMQAERNDKLRDEAIRDQMTGLYNHTAFFAKLDKLVESKEGNREFCLAMIDLDDFKKVNDQYGHDSGDEVLLYFAECLRKFCTESGAAYRYGGEEFAVIFREKKMSEVCEILYKVLDHFRNHRFDFSDSSFTFSAGVAKFAEGMDRDVLFEKADRALYYAKREGKMQIYMNVEKESE